VVRKKSPLLPYATLSYTLPGAELNHPKTLKILYRPGIRRNLITGQYCGFIQKNIVLFVAPQLHNSVTLTIGAPGDESKYQLDRLLLTGTELLSTTGTGGLQGLHT
jgi:hypothetical protein